ncbi:MAG TPA: hypothetical protein VIL37_05320 [Natronosporangium sp.]
MSGATGRRWWRRNWWGLAAIAPLLAAAFLVSPDDSFQMLRDEHTERVVSPGADGWASYGPGRLRLAGFGPAELFDSAGEPFQRPGLTAYQATLVVDAPGDGQALLGCAIELEDVDGRRYPDAPAALGSARNAAGDGVYTSNCSLPYDAEEGQTTFETTAYFLLPSSGQPAALRVSHYEQAPAYVRFELG